MIALGFEILAVALAIAYLLLAARESILCWYCAFASSLIFVFLFWDVSLLMESMLNIFYVVMAVVGWRQWKFGGKTDGELAISTLQLWQHGVIIGLMLSLALINGWLLTRYTSAAWPYLDSFTTWASLITTFMVVFKVLENWLYWFLIDSISIYLYIDRELYLTALLFFAYVIIVVFGYINWRKTYQLAGQKQAALTP
ncbi:MAG: nicotinamide mononucleotide transporter [Gammaproteobacteria bacterium]|nr:nicotinamide mononucleotide transporter [Gammaproteobacteria bacterium]MAY03608.1 nicotinamide mononucleotide transporter [Gammaproteobacteria bacterium]|tara:strand:- start:217 stop:810 length:594 start_codon:yes stop_codon:yes gene_type:complete